MKVSFNTGRRSATVKVAVIALLILVLLIPIGMIHSVIYDRTQIASVAEQDIHRSWGGEQTVAGPVLRLPFKVEKTTEHGSRYVEDHTIFILADNLDTSATASVETRYRGIHEVPVYSADVEMQARFKLDRLSEFGVDSASVDWSGAEVLLGVRDIAAINKFPTLMSANAKSQFAASPRQIAGLPPQLSAKVGLQMQARPDPAIFTAQLSLAINGAGSLKFLPLADNAAVQLAANWPSPSFVGRRLPTNRDITDEGFDASWRSTSLGRKLPASWIDEESTPNETDDGVFGVRLIQPIGLYQLMFRALNYAVMFVGLTFVTFFLIETIGKFRLHPLQYLLVGMSNVLFYMLLISLAEHIGFGIAYAASSFASSALIVGYSVTVLSDRGRAVIMSLVLAGLYAFLYLTLKAESYALLAGSLGLWFILAAVMYLTRKINWYSAGDEDQKHVADS